MKARHRRFALIGLGLLVLAGVVALVLNAFRSNMVFFYSPTQVMQGQAPQNRSFRLGGLVQEGSLRHSADGLSHEFWVTDTVQAIRVRYKGLLPDLFKPGKGVVAQGRLDAKGGNGASNESGSNGVFIATEVLAKHDENYMPPEAAHAVQAAQAAQNAQNMQKAQAAQTAASPTAAPARAAVPALPAVPTAPAVPSPSPSP